jgi:general L-amino acid transport system permease protein
VAGILLLSAVTQFFNWAISTARWAVITENFRVLMQGLYPLDQAWRIGLAVLILTALAGLSWGIWGKMFLGAALAFLFSAALFAFLPTIDRALLGNNDISRYIGDELIPLLRTLREPVLLLLVVLTVGYGLGRLAKRANRKRAGRITLVAWFVLIPACFVLVRGLGVNTPVLPFVSENLWGGLLLTFMMAFVAIVACFPIGVLLAIARVSKGAPQGKLNLPKLWFINPLSWLKVVSHWWRGLGYYPFFKLFSIILIEFVRGVPLITVFFTANLVAGFALGSLDVDAVVRAMIALSIFEAAYIAEIVRGGLQALPPGQAEAARALGMNPVYLMLFITLPQALRTVIPTLVGQFITMFKDTSLVAIIGLSELMGTANGIVAQPGYTERKREVFVFIVIVYFVFSYGMSYAARQLERRGSGGARRK